jgi:hypothetical protein
MSADAVGRHMPMTADGYEILASTPLTWVLDTKPGDHLD